MITAVLFGEQLALGADGAFLAAIAALAELFAVLVILSTAMPVEAFWRRTAPMVLLMVATLAWMSQPVLAPQLLPSRTAMIVAPDLQQGGLVRLTAGMFLLLGAAIIGYRRGGVRRSTNLLLVFGILAVMIGIGFRQIDSAQVWGFDKGRLADRFTGTLLNANASACLSVVLALLGLGRLLAVLRDGILVAPTRSETLAPYLASLAIVIGTGACAITGSRTALAVLLILSVAMVVTDGSTKRLFRSPQGRLALLGAGAIAVLFVALLADITIERFDAIENDGFSRLQIWQRLSAPVWPGRWSGYGLLAFDQVNERLIRAPSDAYHLWYIHSPHDWALSLLLAGGIPYLALMCGMGLLVLLAVIRSQSRRPIDPLTRGMLAALAAIVVCGSVDVALDVPAVTATTAALAGLLYGKALRNR